MGRKGLGHQQHLVSEMRPKRASSININLICPSPGHALSILAMVSGNFFPKHPELLHQIEDVVRPGLIYAIHDDGEDYRQTLKPLDVLIAYPWRF
jgi:hypothetical protein